VHVDHAQRIRPVCCTLRAGREEWYERRRCEPWVRAAASDMGQPPIKVACSGPRQPGEEVLEVEPGMVAGELRRLDEAEREGGGLPTAHAAGEQPVLAPPSDRAQCALPGYQAAADRPQQSG
jgi:hypothetical protein